MSGERSRLGAVALLALFVVYVVWGSTYLAIRVAIETLPGFTMAGVRFLAAGALLYAWGRARGGAAPTRRQWRISTGIGALLLLGGNGGVVWAEHRIDSGVAALLIAIEPVWIALLTPFVLGFARPGWRTALGLALGVAGVAVLVVDPTGNDPTSVDALGALVVVLSALTWALGSLFTVKAELPSSRTVAFGAQMLCGGALLLGTGALAGEWTAVDPARFSGRSLVALAYLVVFGSIAAFTAYGYLLRATPPLVASTYAFVNPLVAVFLGWLLANEAVGPRVGWATLLILGAVALIFRGEAGQRELACEVDATDSSEALGEPDKPSAPREPSRAA
jgi:drug/metabolite transporter (DMT)-like permease